MTKKLTRPVHVTDPETGLTTVYEPGQELAKEHVDLVTNPAAFEEDEETVSVEKAAALAQADAAFPSGTPTENWTHDQLDAKAQADGVEFSSSSLTKREKVAELTGG